MEAALPRRLLLRNTEDITAAFHRLPNFPAVHELVLIDALNVSFVEPTGLAVLAALLRLLIKAKSDGVEVSWRSPRDQNVSNYLARTDFLRAFGVDVPHGRRAPAGRFAELRPIDTATKDISNVVTQQLCAVARANWQASDGAVGMMSYGLGECVDNVVAHSMSTVGGFTCAQCYPRRCVMQFAVSDAGVGIRDSLEETHGIMSDADAIQLAVQKHVTSKSEGHAGEGLYVIREMVAGNGGLLIIHSGNAKYTFDSSRGNEDTAAAPGFPGTLVGIELTLTPLKRLGDIVNELFPEDAPDDWQEWSALGGNGDAQDI